jgi:L-threonylcarbamoyladenylate synthase
MMRNGTLLKTEITENPEIAGEILLNGGVVIFPTETVYGIGASSYNFEACEKIYKIKNRPKDNPLIVHFPDLDSIENVVHISNLNKKRIEILTPGPISFILKKKVDIFSSGIDTIGVRIPKLNITNKMLFISGPVSAPSANLSGKPSITNFTFAEEFFKGKVDCILKGEPTEIGIESTVVDLTSEPPTILRPGGMSMESIRNFIPEISYHSNCPTKLVSPGVKYRHYSPDCKVEWIESISQITNPEVAGYIGSEHDRNLKYHIKINNNLEYMQSLYSFFIECEKRKIMIAYCHKPWEDENMQTLLDRIDKAISKS